MSTQQLQTLAQTKNISLADAQFELMTQGGTIAKVYLMNGICLKSQILTYDENYILMLSREGGLNLVKRSAISTSQATDVTDERFNVDLDGQSIQQFALKQLASMKVNVFLISGIRLTGNIVAFDNESVYLSAFDKDSGRETNQIIQLSSIASISKFVQKQYAGGNY